MWDLTRQIKNYEPTEKSTPLDIFAGRITQCDRCRYLAINTCSLAGQIVSIFARWPESTCPLGLWDCETPPDVQRCGDRVSVIVPTYECGEYLPDCIESLQGQTYAVELIVVDDASTDGSSEILDQYKGIGRLTHSSRRGAQESRHDGLDLATGEWVIFCDADAIYHPRYVERLIERAAEDEADLVYCDYTVIAGDKGTDRRLRDCDGRRLWVDNFIAMPSLVRRSALPEELPAGRCFHDWMLWLDMAQRGCTFAHVPEVLFTVFRRDDGISETVRQDLSGWFCDLLRARRRYIEVARLEKIAVVIPAHEQAEKTIKCVESLIRNTAIDYEIIYVDNGSQESSVRSVLDAALYHGIKLRLIRNEKNLGFARAINQGIKAAKGKNVLLLNNDCYVAPGCVDLLALSMAEQDDCGAIGPLTCDGGEQSLLRGVRASEARYYRDQESPDWFDLPGMASELGIRSRTTADETMLPWFCCLLNRHAIADVGLSRTDGVFATGLGGDDDWCYRARVNGWNLSVHLSAYAAHEGGSTFDALRIDRQRVSRKAVGILQSENVIK